MGDGLFRGHGQHRRPERILDRFQSARLVIEVSQVVLHEADEPNAVLDLLDADLLASEDQIDLAAFKADPAAVRHDHAPVMPGVEL